MKKKIIYDWVDKPLCDIPEPGLSESGEEFISFPGWWLTYRKLIKEREQQALDLFKETYDLF